MDVKIKSVKDVDGNALSSLLRRHYGCDSVRVEVISRPNYVLSYCL